MALFSRASLLLVLLGSVIPVRAVVFNLVAPPDPVAAGGEVRLSLVILNPGKEEVLLPVAEQLTGKLSNGQRNWEVALQAPAIGGPVAIKAGGFAVREFRVTLPPDAQGRLVLDLTEPTGAKVALEAIEAPAVPAVASARPPLTNFTQQATAEGSIRRAFANRFGAHDPIYVIYGNERLAAKFQFSFKYRILGEDASLGDKLPALNRLYFGYTQRSLWDTDADSSPFYDTSYLPELMFESQKVLDPDSPGGFKWVGYQVGVRHESNGQSGATSRSVNTVYVRPGFAFGRFDGWHVIIAPRLSFYVSDLSNNPDIADYRGNVELQTIIGRGNGPALALTSRIGQESGKGSLQAD